MPSPFGQEAPLTVQRVQGGAEVGQGQVALPALVDARLDALPAAPIAVRDDRAPRDRSEALEHTRDVTEVLEHPAADRDVVALVERRPDAGVQIAQRRRRGRARRRTPGRRSPAAGGRRGSARRRRGRPPNCPAARRRRSSGCARPSVAVPWTFAPSASGRYVEWTPSPTLRGAIVAIVRDRWTRSHAPGGAANAAPDEAIPSRTRTPARPGGRRRARLRWRRRRADREEDQHPDIDPEGDGHAEPSKGKPPSKAEIRRVNRARDQLAAACKTLKTTPDDADALRDLRGAARTYLTVFGDSPDATFKRGPNSPEITMRRLLGAVSVYVRDNCGDGASKAVARRLSTATKKSS